MTPENKGSWNVCQINRIFNERPKEKFGILLTKTIAKFSYERIKTKMELIKEAINESEGISTKKDSI